MLDAPDEVDGVAVVQVHGELGYDNAVAEGLLDSLSLPLWDRVQFVRRGTGG